tara:strand:+ start:43 stop:693 length:651 start_codon:yes stop_codon:yes gene_type:complete
MAHRIYETTTHDFDPVNKYIDEKARLRRTKSTWRYTKALALFLIAFGLFLILAAYAYHIFKKPHEKILSEEKLIKSEKVIKQNLNEEILRKDEKIQNLQKEISTNPENQKLQKELEEVKKEKEALENQIKNVVYNSDAVVFEKQTIGDFTITTGFSWNTVDDLRFGKEHVDDWCYLRKSGTTLDYYYDRDASQDVNLSAMNITKSEAENYRKYCSN